MTVAPKSIRIQSSCQYLLIIHLGSTGAKAGRKTLMKLTPEVVGVGHEIKIKSTRLRFSLSIFLVTTTQVLLS